MVMVSGDGGGRGRWRGGKAGEMSAKRANATQRRNKEEGALQTTDDLTTSDDTIRQRKNEGPEQ
ncbi:hypothetical protein Dda_7555 [Drechslerella dactyloides]|uniref:Uncharacterized protein n=1 Tax=Drechslerella dactyloides TaxID=74499 RepID=A0AAD6ISV1_DREDA|nr:hypothetical protein Dda_7555 [Drechslerella dactyloides]